ncbi:MAG: amidohydrolase family protein [Spirochaetales bacterium]|jgi:N-acetylglucosamine-6-phosphate deacetylase|nr:amidohydrolase family protein [Spirochaetales bacterium]
MGSKLILLTGGRIVTPGGILDKHTLVIQNGIIEKLIPAGEEAFYKQGTAECEVIDAAGGIVSPSFCDCHIHGCYDLGFDAVTEESFAKTTKHLRDHGVSTFIPAMQYDESALSRLTEILQSVPPETVPGIYVEGPFIHSEKRGGLGLNSVFPPDPELLEHILEIGRGKICMMTIAPELDGIEKIAQRIVEAGIIPCFGHSNTSYKKARNLYHYIQSYKAGAVVSMTHLFNASSGLTHRNPGLPLLAFLEDLMFEVNGDGIHIDRDMLEFLFLHADAARMMLISDAVVTAGLSREEANDGAFHYHGRLVAQKKDTGGVYDARAGTLIGSASLLDSIIAYIYKLTVGEAASADPEKRDAAITKIILSASTNPGKLLGLGSRQGSIAPGKKSSLLILVNTLHIRQNLL